MEPTNFMEIHKKEVVVSSRSDRELRKRIIMEGDFSIVPYEESRCKIVMDQVKCVNKYGPSEIEAESRIFSSNFEGILVIGDSDSFIDRDFELILQQMCLGEVCAAFMLYRDDEGNLAKEISCIIRLVDVTVEQLVCEWSWERLYEAASYNKEKGVEMVKMKRITDAFRRFNRALKMLIAIEPIDPAVINDDNLKQMIELKVKLYNNLAHCQLHYKEYQPALELCNNALNFDPVNVKALYRRCTAYSGLKMYEEAWKDIQMALQLDPKDKAAIQKAVTLRPIVENINKNYVNVIKKMFG